MTKEQFCKMLETTEPCFEFRNVDYQICTLHGKYLAGLSATEDEDCWFDTLEELLYQWKLQGIPLIDAPEEIPMVEIPDILSQEKNI